MEKWLKKNEEGEWETACKNGKVYDISIMLHGYCDIFAVELGKLFNEKNIYFQYGMALDCEGMVHTYIYLPEDEDRDEMFIDVRGITTSEEMFFDEFDYFFDLELVGRTNDMDDDDFYAIEYYNTEEDLKERLSILCCEDLQHYFEMKDIVEKAKEIIEAFEEYYIP